MILELLDFIKDSPTEITLVLATTVTLVTIWLRNKEVDVASITAIARLQMDQMTSLLEQNAKLSTDIAELRKLTTEQFEVIKELRFRIYELESNYWTEHPDRRKLPRDEDEIL